MPGEPKTSPRRIDSAERRKRALQLKLAGATFEQIARTPFSAEDPRPLYSSRKRAHEAVKKEFDDLAAESKGSAEQLRTMELARLEAMQVALWPSTRPTKAVVCDGCGATMWREPSLEAIDRVIKLIERRSKFLGLDAGGRADQTSGSDGARSMLSSVSEGLRAVYREIQAEDEVAATHVGDPVPDSDDE